MTTAVSMARRQGWAQAAARHGALPGIRLADRTLDGVTCIRLDATVTIAHSEKELAEANFKGYGHHPLLAVCDNTGGEPLAWMLRCGSAGSNTAADHLVLLDAAITALPPAFRRKLMVTADDGAATTLQLAADGQITARGSLGSAVQPPRRRHVYDDDQPSPHPSAWQEAMAEISAAVTLARTDRDAARQLLVLLTIGCRTLDRFEDERAYLFGIGIPPDSFLCPRARPR